jgi:hypothetical protein
MTQPLTAISDAVLDVENNNSIAMGIPLSFLTPLSTSPQPNLKSQCRDPFWPTVWHKLTSIVCKPQHWQVDSLMPLNKTTKIPLKYRQPMTTRGSSCVSSQKGSASTKPQLPKGWVYAMEEVSKEVKTEVVDPNQYQTLTTPLTRSKRKATNQTDNPYC